MTTPQHVYLDSEEAVAVFERCLAAVWEKIRKHYDISGGLPTEDELFFDVELEDCKAAAHQIIANMLGEAMERVGRFSPWYTKPARSYGLMSLLRPGEKRSRWVLAPEAVADWEPQLETLQDVLEQNLALFRAFLLVSEWSASPTA